MPTQENTESLRTVRTEATPIVWVCIAVFNRRHYTRSCLDLLRRQSYPGIRVIVVDDGSTDGTAETITREYPEVTLIRGDGSLYWTGSMNRGVSYILRHAAASDYVLVLNDDLIFEKDLVQRLLDMSALYPRSIIQALESCVDDPGVIWAGGARLNFWTAKQKLTNLHRRVSDFPPGHIEESDYLTGRGLLVPTAVFREAGNYSTRYKQSGDTEFACRASKRGFRLLVTYDVRVLSYEKKKNINEAEQYSLADLKKYYFGVLSHARISTRWSLAVHLTDSFAQALVYFAFDMARVSWHFLSRLSLRPRAS